MEFKLNRVKYINELLAQQWPSKEYALINSAWLAISGFKQNGDLDIIISSKLRKKYFNHESSDKTIGLPGAFEKRIRIHPHNSAYGTFYNCYDVDDLIYNYSVNIEKIKFVELRFFLMYKKYRLLKLKKFRENRTKFIKFLGLLLNQNRVLKKKICRDTNDLKKFEKLLSSNDNFFINNFKRESLDCPKMLWRLD